jgi:hypothetical protein
MERRNARLHEDNTVRRGRDYGDALFALPGHDGGNTPPLCTYLT